MQVKKDIEKAASIGLIPIKAGALGDSLLYLIFANNLARNGYSVTLYSNVLISMQEFFPQVTICNIDFTKDEMERISQKHLFVLADNSITQLFEDAFHERLSELFVFTFYGKTRLIGKGAAFHKTRVKSLVSEAMFEKLLPILDVSNHSIVTNRTLTMADNIALFCEKIWQLKNVTKEVGVILPEYLKYRCHSKRVIIHPTSGNVYKNWSLKKFIKLARLLKAKGFDPVFCVSPAERPSIEKCLNAEFETPLFNSLSELAAFLYESGILIGNDSGTGHLASSLHIPTLTIFYSNPRKKNRWRPGFYFGAVVHAPFKLKFKQRRYWKLFLSVKKVLKAFENFVNELKRQGIMF